MHVAIIPDGNRRWAKDNGKSIIEGYEQGIFVARDVVNKALVLGINYLTLFVLSTENANRSVTWIEAFTGVVKKNLKPMCLEAIQEGCKVQFLGDKKILGSDIEETILGIERQEPLVQKMQLNFCFGYSGRADIMNAVEKMMMVNANVKDLPQFLSTKNIPDPDLIMRTSGEMRISNFLLFESAYSEFFFTQEHWPDFTGEAFQKMIEKFNDRQRRFGK